MLEALKNSSGANLQGELSHIIRQLQACSLVPGKALIWVPDAKERSLRAKMNLAVRWVVIRQACRHHEINMLLQGSLSGTWSEVVFSVIISFVPQYSDGWAVLHLKAISPADFWSFALGAAYVGVFSLWKFIMQYNYSVDTFCSEYYDSLESEKGKNSFKSENVSELQEKRPCLSSLHLTLVPLWVLGTSIQGILL